MPLTDFGDYYEDNESFDTSPLPTSTPSRSTSMKGGWTFGEAWDYDASDEWKKDRAAIQAEEFINRPTTVLGKIGHGVARAGIGTNIAWENIVRSAGKMPHEIPLKLMKQTNPERYDIIMSSPESYKEYQDMFSKNKVLGLINLDSNEEALTNRIIKDLEDKKNKKYAPSKEFVNADLGEWYKSPTWWLEGGAEGATQLAAAAGIGYLSGGSSLPAQVLGTISGGSQIATARERGVNEVGAAAEGIVMGILSSALEKMPMDQILGKGAGALKSGMLATALNFAKKNGGRFAGTAITEGIEEGGENVADVALRLIEGDRDLLSFEKEAWEEVRSQTLKSSALGAATGGLAGVPGTLTDMQRGKRKAELETAKPVIEAQREAKWEGQLRTRADELLQTPEGRAGLEKLAAEEEPSRKHYEEAGFPAEARTTAEGRKKFRDTYIRPKLQGEQVEQPPQPIEPTGPTPPQQFAEGKEYGRALEEDAAELKTHLDKFSAKGELESNSKAFADVLVNSMSREEVKQIESTKGGTPGKSALHQIKEAVAETLKLTGGKTQTNEKKVFGPKGVVAKGFAAAKKALGYKKTPTITKEARPLFDLGLKKKQELTAEQKKSLAKFNSQAGSQFEKYIDPEGSKKILDRAIDDLSEFMSGPGGERFRNYYEEENVKEKEILRQRFPELSDKHLSLLYDFTNALGSAQTQLEGNTQESMDAYSAFRQSGRFPVTFGEDKKPVYALQTPHGSKFEGPLPDEVSQIADTAEKIAARLSKENPVEWNAFVEGKLPPGFKSENQLHLEYLSKLINGKEKKLGYTTSGGVLTRLAKEIQLSGKEAFINRVRNGFLIHGGTSSYNKAYNYDALNQIISRPEFQRDVGGRQQIDAEKLTAWINERVPWSEIQSERKKLGFGKFPADIKREIQDTVWTAEGQEELYPRTFIFGPKVGAYALNRMSAADERNKKYNTMDVWESRFWRYYTDDVPDVEPGIASGTPRRVYMRLARDFAQRFKERTGKEIPVSGGQAARWYMMKHAAAKMGYSKAGEIETIPYHTMKAMNLWMDTQLAAGREGDLTEVLVGVINDQDLSEPAIAKFEQEEERRAIQSERPGKPTKEELSGPWNEKPKKVPLQKEFDFGDVETETKLPGESQEQVPASEIKEFEDAGKIIVNLFQKKEGRIVGSMEEINRDGRTKILIRALKGSNLETGMHEMAHVLRRVALNRDIPANIRGITDTMLTAVEEAYGVEDGKWSRDQEERFAEDLLRRMQRPPKTPPKSKLAKALTRVMNYLTNLYRSAKDKGWDVHPVWDELFDQLLTRRERLTMKKKVNVQLVRNNSTDNNIGGIIKKARADGGGTIDMKDMSRPTSGFGVAPDKATETIIPQGDDEVEASKRFISKYEDRLSEDKNHFGLWVNGSGQLVLDVSRVEPDLNTAMKIAKDAQQDGVWDFKNNKFIDTKEYFASKGQKNEINKEANVRTEAPKENVRTEPTPPETVSGRNATPEEVRYQGEPARGPAIARTRTVGAPEGATEVRPPQEKRSTDSIRDYEESTTIESREESLSQGRIDWTPYGANGQRTGKAKPAREVVRDILASVGIVADVYNEHTMGKSVAGFYRWAMTNAKIVQKTGQELWLKASELASIHTATHEVAHFLDQKFNLSGKLHQLSNVPGLVQPTQRDIGFLAKLPAATQNAFRMLDYHVGQYGTLRPDKVSGLAEGWAEAVRYYVTLPDPTVRLTPDIKSTMDAIILQYPELAKILNETRSNSQAYLNAPDAEKVQMMLHDPTQNVLARPSESYFARQDRMGRARKYWRTLAKKMQNKIRDLEEYEKVLFETFVNHWTQPGTGQTRKDAQSAWDDILRQTGGLSSVMILNLQNRVSRGIDRAINDGVIDPVSNTRIGGPATDIFVDFTSQKQMDDFGRYMYAKVALYRHTEALAEGKEYIPGETELAVLNRYVQSIESGPDAQLFAKAVNDTTDYFNSLLEIEVGSGLLTRGQANAIKSSQTIYMPFFRQLEEGMKGGSGGKVIGVKNVHRRLKSGSVMPVLDVYDAIIDRTSDVMSSALRKHAETAFIRQAELSGVSGNWVRKLTAAEAEQTKDVVKIQRDGSTYYYKIDPDLKDALTLSGLQMPEALANMLKKANSITALARKLMVTFNLPYFTPKNFIVDLKSSALRGLRTIDEGQESSALALAGRAGIRGLGDAIRAVGGKTPVDTDVERLFKDQGLSKSTRVKSSRSKGRSKHEKRRTFLKGKDRTGTQIAADFLSAAAEYAESINDAIELGPRRQAFIQTLELIGRSANSGFSVNKDGSINGTVPEWALNRATSNAMEITTNFNRRGEWQEAIEPLLLFYNANVQGTATMIDTGKGALTSSSHRKKLAVAVGLAAIAKIAMFALMADDEDENGVSMLEHWAELPDYLHEAADVYVVKGNVVTIPREREWGIFHALVDAVIQDMINENKVDPGHIWNIVRNNAMQKLPVTGGVGSTFLQSYFGYDLFRDEPIESEYDKKKRVKNRYDDRTSTLAKWVGELSLDQVSPKQADFWMRNTFGSMVPKAAEFIRAPGEKKSAVPVIGPYMHDMMPRQTYTDYHVLKERSGQLYDDWSNHGGEYSDSDLQEIVDMQATIGLTDTIAKAIRDSDMTDLEKAKWTTGLARWALDREPLESYPNPLKDFRGLPAEVTQVVLKELKEVQAAKARPTKAAPKGSEQIKQKQSAVFRLKRKVMEANQ